MIFVFGAPPKGAPKIEVRGTYPCMVSSKHPGTPTSTIFVPLQKINSCFGTSQMTHDVCVAKLCSMYRPVMWRIPVCVCVRARVCSHVVATEARHAISSTHSMDMKWVPPTHKRHTDPLATPSSACAQSPLKLRLYATLTTVGGGSELSMGWVDPWLGLG